MQKLELFPTEVFVFQNDDVDNESLIEIMKTLNDTKIKKSTNISIIYDLQSHPAFKDLFLWFEECLEKIRITQHYDCDKISITNSWFNVSLGGYKMFQNYHKHSMSMFSAVYYMTPGSATIFEDPEVHRTEA